MYRVGPMLCFFAQVALVATVWAACHRYRPVEVPDTPSYRNFPWHDLQAAFTSMRTPGYPLVLDASAALGFGDEAIPLGSFLVEVAVLLFVWKAVSHIVRSPWYSMWITSSLLYSHFFFRYASDLAPDYLAAVVSLVVVSALIQAVLAPRWTSWCALATGVFLTCLLRPAYLFLLVYVPIAAAWLRAVVPSSRRVRGKAQWWVLLLSATWLPLASYATARWLVAGHWGLVCFGGANAAGVVTAFLDSGDVARLPESVRPLAAEVLHERQRVAAAWPGQLADPTRSYTAIERGFDLRTWAVCVPAARRLHGGDWCTTDGSLARLAWTIITVKPVTYLLWLGKSFCFGLRGALGEYVTNPVYLVLLLVVAVYPWTRHPAMSVGPASSSVETNSLLLGGEEERSLGGGSGPTDDPPESTHGNRQQIGCPTSFWELQALWILAVSYLGTKLLFVSLSTPPLGRFTGSAALLLAWPLSWSFSRSVQSLLRIGSRKSRCLPAAATGHK